MFPFLSKAKIFFAMLLAHNSKQLQIFKDPLTTAAAIDRVVHHSIIIEFGSDIKSMRMEAAAKQNPPLPAHVG